MFGENDLYLVELFFLEVTVHLQLLELKFEFVFFRGEFLSVYITRIVL